MKKIILIIFIDTFTSCNFFFQLQSDKELTEKINSEYLKERKPINLSKLTDFDWDNYIVIGCYQNVEQVGEQYKIDLSNISGNAISSSDWFILLVFIKDKKAIKICEVKMDTKFDEHKLLKK
ncbi:hypothetical protein [Flavobacterium sp.]|uniref:hypothetical protein n=1 Tax=Flavobacterium sp. TaxID=239 RepID=UPI003F69C09F